jgi:ankyrin repeat protein
MTRASGKILNVHTLLILAFMLMWSGFAMCGEIHEAVKKNDTAKVKELIKANPDLVFSKDDEGGFTPLHLAAANGNREMVRFLLTAKADVNAKDNAGSTPMHQVAMAKGPHSDLIEMLLMQGAEVDARDKHGLTPLHYATMADNPTAVKTLLDHAANVNARDNNFGNTPLIIAAVQGHEDVARLLLENGANVNLTDGQGTPLAWAIRSGHLGVADLIRKHGAH